MSARPLPLPRPSYKWELLTLLWMANFLNQGDRQIFNSILPLIRSGLNATDVQMGLVATTFTAVYGLLVPVAGWVGDRASRKWVVCLSLLVFSVGTLLTGVAGGLIALIVFRSVATGAGESFYTPSAISLLSQYHQKTRALAMAINQTSLYVGVVASSWIAAYLAERYGWRAAFYAFGGFGLILGFVLMARLRDDPVERHAEEAHAPTVRETLRALGRKPTVLLLSAAFGCMVFVQGGFLTWMPTLLFEKFGLPLTAAALRSVLVHHIFAFLGVLAGGWWSDRQASERPVARLYVCAFGLLLAAPFIYGLGSAGSLLTVEIALAAFGFFRGVYDSNIYAALYEVVPARYRASATGLMISVAFGTGALAPLLLGYIKKSADLSTGMMVLAPFYALGAGLIVLGAWRYFPRDRNEATLRAE